MIIEFGNWQLRPVDSRNWQLYHYHVPAAVGRHKGGTEPRWMETGRFYHYKSIDHALLYAADCDIKAMDGTVNFMEYVTLLRETLDGFEKSILTSLEPRHSPANDNPR